jgi:hypothetical protein
MPTLVKSVAGERKLGHGQEGISGPLRADVEFRKEGKVERNERGDILKSRMRWPV